MTMTLRASWLVATLVVILTAPPAAAATAPAEGVTLVHAGQATGSAFAVGDGNFVTARHVVAGHEWVRLSLGVQTPSVPAQVIALDDLDDVAVLHVPASTRPSLPHVLLTLGDAPTTGEQVTAIGYPGGGPLVQRGGQVVTVDPEQARVDLAVQAGMSGGPLLDADGRVVGVLVARRGRQAVAVPAPRLANALAAAASASPRPPTGAAIPHLWKGLLSLLGLGVGIEWLRHQLRRPGPSTRTQASSTAAAPILIDLGPVRCLAPTRPYAKQESELPDHVHH